MSDQGFKFDEDDIEAGRRLFAQPCRFLKGVVSISGLPSSQIPEVAFAGRSNVGKSSLINTLTGRKTLARTSNTPGRTQEINFFHLGDRLMLVDLPGYGFARVSKARVKQWTELIKVYLRGRPNLRRVILLIDGRHGVKASDDEIMTLLDEAAVNYQVVLTKCDKPKSDALDRVIADTRKALSKHVAAHPVIIATSATSGMGIADLRAAIAELALG